MLEIDYESEKFPPGILQNGRRKLVVTWDDILWAAITLGRPDLYHVFRHGSASLHEALFRLSMVRMALQQRGWNAPKLERTNLFKQMDPTEKGAVSYFLGLLTCKLFADKLLGAPWTLHLDVFRRSLNPLLLNGRSRPDMVAQSTTTRQWHALECKGRSNPPGEKEKKDAKMQADRLISINRTPCSLHVGAITYFRKDTLEFYWQDPEPTDLEPIKIEMQPLPWQAYYAPIVEVVRAFRDTTSVDHDVATISYVAELDLTVKIHPGIAPLLLESNWQKAREVAMTLGPTFTEFGFQPDGLMVKAGSSWQRDLEDSDSDDEDEGE